MRARSALSAVEKLAAGGAPACHFLRAVLAPLRRTVRRLSGVMFECLADGLDGAAHGAAAAPNAEQFDAVRRECRRDLRECTIGELDARRELNFANGRMCHTLLPALVTLISELI